MRRKDQEMSGEFALEVVRDFEYGVLATVNSDNTPYAIAISPVLFQGAVYFHCADEGKKLDNIAANPCVCLTCVQNTKLIPERFTTLYESAVVFGKCEIVSEKEEKIAVLRALCEKYARSNMVNFDDAAEKSIDRTCICKITIDAITGKANR